MESMNDLYDQINHPENAFLIGFMFLANTYGVNMQPMVNSLKTFNSANCVNASFRDKINEGIAQTCCYREDQLKRDISAMQMQQVQWKMIDGTIGRIHTACTENRERLNTSILQSSKTSFDQDSRILTIEHDTEGVAFYVDNMPHETVSTTVEKEKAKPDDIFAGDGVIMRALRKLVMTANSIIGWFVDELSHDFL